MNTRTELSRQLSEAFLSLAANSTTEIRIGFLKRLQRTPCVTHSKKMDCRKANTQWNGKKLKKNQTYCGKVV